MLIPHHVTGFWLPVYREDLLKTGSIGAGLLLAVAKAEVKPDKTAVYNGIDVTRLVATLLARRGVAIHSDFPLGYGYAGSAVIAIAAALANFPREEALRRAHLVEVLNKTGLGDVLAIATGGCLVYRIAPGAPGVGVAKPLKCPKAVAITVDLTPKSTAEMLADLRHRIHAAGEKTVSQFQKNPNFENFLHLAREFSREVGFLTPRVVEIAARLKGLVGYYVKKGVGVFVVEPEWIHDALTLLTTLGATRAVELRDVEIQAP